MSVSIVTKANLGEKKNLKTDGIMPVIAVFAKQKLLVQILCQMHTHFDVPNTHSYAPAWYRYVLRILEYIPGISMQGVRRFVPDALASMQLQCAAVVFVHPAAQFARVARKAKKRGSTTIGIATVAHPVFEAALYTKEYARFGVTFDACGRFDTLHAALASIDYIIAYSDFVKETYVQHGFPEEQIFVAYSDIPLPQKVPVRHTTGTFKVLFLAYATPRKGLQYLLEAWDMLDLPDAELVVVGGYGSEAYTPKEFKTYCDAIIARNPSITWVGKVTDTTSYYRDASLFVFPSLSEGNPKVVMEAMAHGLPVITTPNAQSVVEDGVSGYVVPIRDVQALQEKITVCYTHRTATVHMGNAARNTMEQKKPFGEAVFAVYKKIISNQQ
ncbi:MAG: glycosyltransferase family 4 protein [Candidatus Pacebacteria bacterium]|nr:glycosyltransferase family 4 protein [Candidatus Paceibacterota bacterium]